jgi:hypothetical protein
MLISLQQLLSLFLSYQRRRTNKNDYGIKEISGKQFSVRSLTDLATYGLDFRESRKMQALTAKIGQRMGLKIWIPKSYRSRVLEYFSLIYQLVSAVNRAISL